ncbi:MAG: tetratricopeptide repeat protein [Candidatus Omnitrophota bacterium]
MDYFKKNLAKYVFMYYPYIRQRDMKFKNLNIIIYAVLFFVAFLSPCLALDSEEQAQEYRKKGYYAQQQGDIQGAIEFYLKALSINPDLAIIYNDLGIVYETLEEFDLAEDSYLNCLKINKNYLPAYTNLAFLYEKNNQLKKAAYFWKKRSELGDPNDYWTRKAKKNLERLMVYSPEINEMLIQEEADSLTQEVKVKKAARFNTKLAKAKEHFELGKKYFNQERYSESKEQFQKALLLTPNDPTMLDYYKKAKKNEEDKKVKLHIQEGMKYYERGDMRQAREEFEDLLTVIPDKSNH